MAKADPMGSEAATFRYSLPYEPHFEKLLYSSAKASYDPDKEIDWAAPLDPTKYGLNPEWSSLYGTKIWSELSEEERVLLTRHEVASIMSTGIWFEGILQAMLLRATYSAAYGTPEFRYALVEIADECRHSLMFSRVCEKLEATTYRPKKLYHELGRGFRILSSPELIFASILAAEECLDIMQRDWMRGENVLDEVRISSKIHVVEEARHMKYARIELRQAMEGLGRPRREAAAIGTAVVASVIFDALIHPDVYRVVGLDPQRAKAIAYHNPHRQEMMRLGNERLMGFFQDVGLLTPAAQKIYRRVHAL